MSKNIYFWITVSGIVKKNILYTWSKVKSLLFFDEDMLLLLWKEEIIRLNTDWLWQYHVDGNHLVVRSFHRVPVIYSRSSSSSSISDNTIYQDLPSEKKSGENHSNNKDCTGCLKDKWFTLYTFFSDTSEGDFDYSFIHFEFIVVLGLRF